MTRCPGCTHPLRQTFLDGYDLHMCRKCGEPECVQCEQWHQGGECEEAKEAESGKERAA